MTAGGPQVRWLSHVRSVLGTEIHAVRNRKLDLNPADLTRFTFPLMLGLAGVLAFGAVPLVVIRSSVSTDDVLVPLVGSLALTAVGTAVMTWLIAIVVSGLVLMVFYRTAPTTSSRLVIRTVVDSFDRVSDTAARLATLALVAGLVALAIGLPTRRDDEFAHPVIDDLLTAQIGVLLAALGVAYLAETVRCAAELVDRQSLLLAWPWSLGISCVSWVVATTIGPFETTRTLEVLLNEWLPATVNGTSRADVIADLLPASANWWAAVAPLPVITLIWILEARRDNGFVEIRELIRSERDDLRGVR
ncbi:hypothetical protein [Mycobacterium sp. 852002-51961_SCH5331710]|uniref:hypothetical protein n=1 Tax=Mycobacterium sp. 852002-51961_SCH5331710 TaxID=1834105 RepID=UPI0007FD290D|nr:hypothetical protein [Mycobacterium sp. 852002-51961_SCH5331710]OBB44657.1 hypothetical protein A5752_03720 [Mycobacterium sp. 852002-51961_SCH5331710]